MDNQEVLDLLKIVEESGRHGQTFMNIRNEAQQRLIEINTELAPEKLEEEVYEPEGVTGNNPPPAQREPDGIDNDDDGVTDEPDEVHGDDTPTVARRP